MKPRFELLNELKLVGIFYRFSLTQDRTYELWNTFMKQQNAIKHSAGSNKYSVRVYDSTDYFINFKAEALLTKWAAIEVTASEDIPPGMETLIIPAGEYAVFVHRGASSEASTVFGYIFGEWLPKSGYQLDNRPHFEILGEKYIQNNPLSEEEIWVPIKKLI